jgi:hypothetical protein
VGSEPRILLLTNDSMGICRGPVGYPCKSLFLGEPGEDETKHGVDESCLSRVCDVALDMCTDVGAAVPKALIEDSSKAIFPSTLLLFVCGLLAYYIEPI